MWYSREKGGLGARSSILEDHDERSRMATPPTRPPLTVARTLPAGSVSADCWETVKNMALEEMLDALCALEGVTELVTSLPFSYLPFARDRRCACIVRRCIMTPQSDTLPGNQPTLKPTRVARAILAYLP